MIKENKKILLINFLVALTPSILLLVFELFSLNNVLLTFIFLSFLIAGVFSGYLFSFEEKVNFPNILKLAFFNGILFGFSSIILDVFYPFAEKIATKTMVSIYIGMSSANESNLYVYLAKSATRSFFWVTLFFTTTSFIGIYIRNKNNMYKAGK
jgi:hypothetical protein